MRKKLFIVLIFTLAGAIYLNRSYARIYNRNETNLIQINWPEQISFQNHNFQNSVKYVALGDSLTRGVGSNNINDTLIFIIAEKISQKMSVSLVNLAVSGATTDDLIKFQLEKAIKEQPSYVTLLIGINDIHNFSSSKNFQQNMNLILNRLTRETGAKIIVFNLPYLGSTNLILPPFSIYINYKTKQFNKIINNISLKYNVTLIDLYSPTKEVFDSKPNFYSSDEFHPQGVGYRLWGQLIDEQNI